MSGYPENHADFKVVETPTKILKINHNVKKKTFAKMLNWLPDETAEEKSTALPDMRTKP